MAGLRTVFFDTSILVAGTLELGGDSEAALSLMDAVAEGRIESPLTAWHCCLEYFSVATRLPEEYRLEPSLALRFLRDEILARFTVLDLPEGARQGFLAAVAADGVAGGRVYDAHIAEVARAGGARVLLTDNRRHFSSLLRHGVRVLTAAEGLEELAEA